MNHNPFLAAAIAALAAGCGGGGWPGVCGSETINADTWQTQCACVDRTGAAIAAWNFCFDGSFPSVWTLNEQCDRAAWELTRLGGYAVTCEPAGGVTRTGTDDCPLTVAAACEDLSSSSSPLLDASAQPLHGWVNPYATFVGTVDTSRSWVEITVRGETARPAVTGQAYVTGGDCPGEECAMRVDGLTLQAYPFTLHGAAVDQVQLVDWGWWNGTKRADDTYKFSTTDARLKLSASIGGDKGAIIGEPIGIPGGQFYPVAAPLPGGGIAPNGYMTIEGTFTLDEGEARVFLVLPFGHGAPRPSVTATFVPCDVAAEPECGWVFDASWSRDFHGGPIAEYRWHDAFGELLGNGSRLAPGSLYGAIAYPITVTVVDGGGRIASTTVGDAERSGAHGWVWANQASSASYTPSTGFQFNSTGATNTVTRSGTGNYQIRFPGLGGAGGIVHVSAYGSGAAYCKSAGWSASGGDLLATVRCFDATGTAVDSKFNALYAREHNDGPGGGTTAYLWANNPTAADYLPSTSYSYNDTGAQNRVRRTGTGRYTVELPGMADSNASVLVTAYGAGSERCAATGWWTSGTGAFVSVACTTAAGAPANTRFNLAYVVRGVLGLGSSGDNAGAYAWADQPTSASYAPGAGYAFTHLGSSITARRVGTGNYRIDIPLDAPVTRDTVLVNAYGDGGDHCKVGGWSRGTTQTTLTLRCYNAAGAPRDARFDVSYLTSNQR